jgi:serine/threonine protein kinase
LAEVAAEESGSTGLSDSQGPNDKPEKGSPAIGRSEGAGSKGATDTPNETEKDVKKGDEEEELTPEELEIEQRIVLKGDPVKLFKSFQAHGSGYVFQITVGFPVVEITSLSYTVHHSGFGTVERAKHIETKTQVAVKHVPHKTIKQRKTNIQEISFLKALKGKKNVVEYFGTYAHNEELWVRFTLCLRHFL